MTIIIIATVLIVLIIALVVYKSKGKMNTQEETIQASNTTSRVKKDLPACKYPVFDHARLIEMGLEEKEALEFVQELILQIDNTIPSIKSLIENANYKELEPVIHGVKGAANNVGVGGVSELLSELHHYLRSTDTIDKDTLNTYYNAIIKYTKSLKNAYR
jgi:hypothetical protein